MIILKKIFHGPYPLIICMIIICNNSCDKNHGPEEEWFHFPKNYIEKVPLLDTLPEGNYKKITSPDGHIIIKESIDLETINSFGGTTSFEKLNITIGKIPVAKYLKVFKDSLERNVILMEGELPKGNTLEEKAINFKPDVTSYLYYYDKKSNIFRYDIADIIVGTVFGNFNNNNINELENEKEKLTKELSLILSKERVFFLKRMWRYIKREYQQDVKNLSVKNIFDKYNLKDEDKKKVEDIIRKIQNLNTKIGYIRSDKSEKEYIHKISKTDKIYNNGNVEYLTQKGVTTQSLTGKNEFDRYKEISIHLHKSQNSQKPPLDGISESYKEINDNSGKNIIVLTGYNKVNRVTGFVEGEPYYIEFRIYPPPFRKLTRDQIMERIKEIEEEINNEEWGKSTDLPYFKTQEYIQNEKEILEESLKNSQNNNAYFIVYLPEILLYYAGIAVESYTYKYDPKKSMVTE